MIADNGTLCNAAVQLFCKGPDIHPRMKLGLLAGNTKAKILDLRQECGTLFELLDLAGHFVASNIRQIGEGGSLSHSKAGAISPKLFAALDSREKLAVRLAAERGKVTPRELAEADGSSRKTAGATLKELTSKGILIWSGKSANDPYQFYRLPWQLGSTGRHWEALGSTGKH